MIPDDGVQAERFIILDIGYAERPVLNILAGTTLCQLKRQNLERNDEKVHFYSLNNYICSHNQP